MKAEVISSNVFLSSPAAGTGVHATSFYTTRDRLDLVSWHGYLTRSDTVDVAYRRFSQDHGRTWSEAETWPTRFDHPTGTGRRHPRGAYVDPHTGRLLTLWTEGVLPTDHPLEGLRQWKLYYEVSEDGGRTSRHSGQIIHHGEAYDAVHHMPGITVGKNCLMMGDMGERPLTRSDGMILVPVQSSPTGPDGVYHNPGAGFTYTDCLILFGRWRPDGDLEWRASQRVCGDPERTTRGLIEPTIAELGNGRLLMVMRGSNDVRPQWPGYRWHALSHDGGETWSTATPWTWTDGTPFFSPSSCSQLVPVADGRLFWLGNISLENPRGNSPRYPLVLHEVDLATGLLIRDSGSIIADRQPDESPHLTLSNFYIRENRETSGLVLHLSRLYAHDFRHKGEPADFTADALVYNIQL